MHAAMSNGKIFCFKAIYFKYACVFCIYENTTYVSFQLLFFINIPNRILIDEL